jgi:hypothetical protein
VQKHNLVEIPNVLLLFQEYCEKIEARITRALFEKNLAEKRSRSDFSDDIRPLLAPEVSWHFEDALQMVQETIIRHLPGKPWKR